MYVCVATAGLIPSVYEARALHGLRRRMHALWGDARRRFKAIINQQEFLQETSLSVFMKIVLQQDLYVYCCAIYVYTIYNLI